MTFLVWGALMQGLFTRIVEHNVSALEVGDLRSHGRQMSGLATANAAI